MPQEARAAVPERLDYGSDPCRGRPRDNRRGHSRGRQEFGAQADGRDHLGPWCQHAHQRAQYRRRACDGQGAQAPRREHLRGGRAYPAHRHELGGQVGDPLPARGADARLDGGAGAPPCAVRQGGCGHARRLQHRRPQNRHAHPRPRGPGREVRYRPWQHPCLHAKRPDRRNRHARLCKRRRDRKPHDGLRPCQGHDHDRQRGPRAGDRRPRQPPERNGRPYQGRGLPRHRDRGHRRAASPRHAQDGWRPHRGRHLHSDGRPCRRPGHGAWLRPAPSGPRAQEVRAYGSRNRAPARWGHRPPRAPARPDGHSDAAVPRFPDRHAGADHVPARARRGQLRDHRERLREPLYVRQRAPAHGRQHHD